MCDTCQVIAMVHAECVLHLVMHRTLRADVNDSTSSMSTNTRQLSSSTSSVILANSLDTSLPLSLNHLLNRLCALISTSCPWVYLQVQHA